jgi:TRAP-type C4-dicarboxylate transport system permease small subunit
MFKRLMFDTWEGLIPTLGFALTAFAFLLIMIRALRMKKTEANHLAHLPLEDATPAASPQDHVH